MGIAEDIKRQFPELYWLLRDKEVGKLLRKAVNPDEMFSPERFKAELYGTKWWRSRSANNRNWEILYHTDPDTANERRRTFRTELFSMSKQLGVSPSLAQRNWITEWALGNGLSVDSLQVRQKLIKLWDKGDNYRGTIGVDSQEIRAMARADFFRPMGEADANKLARRIAYGDDTMESVRARLTQQAADRFPHLKAAIVAGQTPAEIVQGHRELVAQELELGSLEAVNVMSNSKWRQLLGIQGDGGVMRLPTDSEVINMARTENSWWKTKNGKDTDASFAQGLLTALGKRR